LLAGGVFSGEVAGLWWSGEGVSTIRVSFIAT
jgi:hypothetical protein